MTKSLPKFSPRRRYSLSSWMLLCETGVSLATTALLKRLLPFRIVSRLLGRQVERPTASPLPDKIRTDLSWAYRVFQKLPAPLRPVCLTEVLALCLMLRRRRLYGTSALGARKDASNLRLHAWMLCGSQVLPRSQDLRNFHVIALFEP